MAIASQTTRRWRRCGLLDGYDVTPLSPGADEPAEGVEDVAQIMLAPAGVFGEQAEIGPDELPLRVGGVTGVMLVSDHTLNYVAEWTKVHNTL
jgi:hypothetical protein